MKTMPKSTMEEKLRWIKPILDKEITIKNMAKVCPFSERSIKYWLANYREYGLDGLENKSTRPKTNPKETSIRIKEAIVELRNKTKLSAIKLHWKLEKESILIHERTIGKILKREGLTRKYRTRKIKYKYIKVPLSRGELVEIDVKYVPDLVKSRHILPVHGHRLRFQMEIFKNIFRLFQFPFNGISGRVDQDSAV